MRILKALLLALLLSLILLPSAYAGDPAIPADEELVASLLPEYTLVEGNIHNGELRLLMTRPDGVLVFVGAVQDQSGDWMLAESTPLPEGTVLGVENFVHSLGIPSENDYHLVSLQPYADYTWGVSLIYPDGEGLFSLGKDWISGEVHAVEGYIGLHPWSNIAEMDWTTLPASLGDAVARRDTSLFAVVNNPDPADRLHLREEPSREAASMGKFYNGTPVHVLEWGEEWTAVNVAGHAGWMMTKYLAFGEDMDAVDYAGPWLDTREEMTRIYDRSEEEGFRRMMDQSEEFYVIGLDGEDWYIIWLVNSEEYAHVRQADLWAGNG